MPLADDTTLTGLVRRRWPIAEPQDAMLDSNDTARRLSQCWPDVEMRLLPTPVTTFWPGAGGALLPHQTRPAPSRRFSGGQMTHEQPLAPFSGSKATGFEIG